MVDFFIANPILDTLHVYAYLDWADENKRATPPRYRVELPSPRRPIKHLINCNPDSILATEFCNIGNLPHNPPVCNTEVDPTKVQSQDEWLDESRHWARAKLIKWLR